MSTDIFLPPNWKRVGFAHPPDVATSGKDIGIVILDWLRPHATLRHLGDRIKYIIVEDDLSVTCRNIAFEEPPQSDKDDASIHGLMSVLLLSHAPLQLHGEQHGGLAPAATFLVLNHGAFRPGEGQRLQRGIAWLLERREEWNIRLILSMGWNVVPSSGYIQNTWHKPTVQGLRSAVDAGILIIASNGNTRFENELPPIDYFTVGGFNDHPLAATPRISSYPDQPWGRNGDGHLRPDILAPMLYLPVPYCETYTPLTSPKDVSFFWQTSGAGTLVTGICAHILSQFPKLRPDTLRQALIQWGDKIPDSSNPAPRVNVEKTLQALTTGTPILHPQRYPPPIQVRDPAASLQSPDEIERALALTMLMKQDSCSREALWTHVQDKAAPVRKVAITALEKPRDAQERQTFWDYLQAESEGGVRGHWIYGLLHEAQNQELPLWLSYIEDVNWAVRWCVREYLQRFPELPPLEMTFDLDLIHQKAMPLKIWYE